MNDSRRSLGRFLTALRHVRSLSRYQLAEAMGVKYPYLANIENGQRPLTEAYWSPVSLALDLPPGVLRTLVTAAEADRRPDQEAPALPVAINEAVQALSPGLKPWQRLALLAAQEEISAVESATSPADPTYAGRVQFRARRGDPRSIELRRRLDAAADQLSPEDLERLTTDAEELLRLRDAGQEPH